MQQLAEWISTTLIKNGKLIPGRCKDAWLIKNAPDQWQAVVASTTHLPLTASRAERIHCALYGISAPVRCPVCRIRAVPFRKGSYARTCGESACTKSKLGHVHVASPMQQSVRDKLSSKEWLKEQLLAKAASDVAAELHVPIPVVLSYAIQFDLEVERGSGAGVKP